MTYTRRQKEKMNQTWNSQGGGWKLTLMVLLVLSSMGTGRNNFIARLPLVQGAETGPAVTQNQVDSKDPKGTSAPAVSAAEKKIVEVKPQPEPRVPSVNPLEKGTDKGATAKNQPTPSAVEKPTNPTVSTLSPSSKPSVAAPVVAKPSNPGSPQAKPIKPVPGKASVLGKSSNAGSSRFGVPPVPSYPVSNKSGIRVERAVTFWVLDGDGNWKIPLPNWSIEDILGKIDAQEDKEKELPYTIQSINVDGRVENDIAQLKVEYRINTTSSAITRVPLGLKEGVCIPEAGKKDFYDTIVYTGPGSYSIEYDENLDGYVAVIQNRTGNNRMVPDTAAAAKGDGKSGTGDTATKEKKEDGSNSAMLNAGDRIRRATSGLNLFRSNLNLHTLTLNLCFPVEKLGNNEYLLKASFPPAVHAKLTLQVPMPDVQVRVGQGGFAMPPITLNEKTSEIVLGGLNRNGEPTEIVWYKKGNQIERPRIMLQVEEAQIDVTPSVLDVQYSVRLPIRVYGRSTDTFRIRLPRDTHLVRDSLVATGLGNAVLEIRDIKETEEEYVMPIPIPDAMTATVTGGSSSDVSSDSKEKKKPEAEVGKKVPCQTIEVVLAQKVGDSLVLQFKAIAQNDDRTRKAGEGNHGETSPLWELGGFEVLNAQKQHGRIRIQFPEDLNFKVTPLYGVRSMQEDIVETDASVEQYRFFTQPFSLKVQVLLRRTRIKVKPEYQISIQQGRLEMKALFRFVVHGSKIRQISLRFGDWVINEVKSNYIVDTDKIYTDPVSKEVILPLTVGSEGVIDIELAAVRDMTLKDGLLEFPIPVPVADWMEPAAVVVVPDDNIELLTLPEKMKKLRFRTQRSFSLSLEIPQRQQPPLVFQMASRDNGRATSETTDNSLPWFASKVLYHSRRVEVQSQTEVAMTENENQHIRQTLLYHVSYEPLESLVLLVPRELQDPAAIKITIQGRPVPPQKIVTESVGGSESKMVRKKIFLTDDPMMGNATVVLNYQGKHIELLPQMSNKIVLDLIQPADGTLLLNELSVVTPQGIAIEYPGDDKSSWKADETSPIIRGETISWLFTSRKPEQQIVLRGILDARDVLGTTIADRAWIQTWLIGTTRLDRIVWRIISDQKSVLLDLPRQVRQDRVSVLLNNEPYYGSSTPSSGTDNRGTRSLFDRQERLVVQIPSELKLKPFTLEVSYAISIPEHESATSIDFPQFVGNSVWVRRTYWQLVLPNDRHLVGDIDGWTPEYYNNIVRTGFFWSRTASMDQDELCNWTGVPVREKIPMDTNCYLLSSFNPPKMSTVQVTERITLIFIGSCFTLLTGLCLIYFPVFRHRGPLLFIAVMFIGLCTWRPAATLLFLQTSVFGLILTVLAVFLARIFNPGHERYQPEKRHIPAAVYHAPSKGSKVHSSSLWVEERGDTITLNNHESQS